MKIKLLILALFFSISAFSQQTFWPTSIPPGSVGFSPAYRFLAGATDSLNSVYFSNGSKYYRFFSAAESGLRYPNMAYSYNNPSWISSLNWSKITSKPTTLSGYGITDGVTTAVFNTTTGTSTQAQINTKASTTYLDSITNVLSPRFVVQAGSPYNAFGDSYTAGYLAVPLTVRYTSYIATNLGLVENNYGHTGDGANQMIRLMYQSAPAFNNKFFTTSMIGYNDLTYIGKNQAGYNKAGAGARAVIANHFLKTIVASSDATIAKTGTWVSISSASTKSNQSLGKNIVYSAVSGSTLTWTTPVTTNVVVGLLGCDSTITDGRVSITIDGGTPWIYQPKGKTKFVSGHDNNSTRINDAYIKTGLTNDVHTVVVTALDNTLNAFTDFFGTLQAPNEAPPLLIGAIVFRNAAGYAYQAPPIKDSLTVVAYNDSIRTQLNLIKGYPAKFIEHKTFNPYTQLLSDNIHPTPAGHTNLGQDFVDGVTGEQDYLKVNTAQRVVTQGYSGNYPTTPGSYLADTLSRYEMTKLGADNLANTLRFNKQRGTIANPLPVLNSDQGAHIRYYGWDGNAYTEFAGIRSYVAATGTISSNNIPGELGFFTRNGANLATRLFIASDGKSVISSLGGVVNNPLSTLELRGTNNNTGGLTIWSTLPRAYLFGNGSGSFTTQLAQASAVYNVTNSSGTNLMQISDVGVGVGGQTTPTAALHLPASTTARAAMTFNTTSAVSPTSPNPGDVWPLTNHQLYYRNSTTTNQIIKSPVVSAVGGNMLFQNPTTGDFVTALPTVTGGLTYSGGSGSGTFGLDTNTIAPKAYVNNFMRRSGGTFTGPVIFSNTFDANAAAGFNNQVAFSGSGAVIFNQSKDFVFNSTGGVFGIKHTWANATAPRVVNWRDMGGDVAFTSDIPTPLQIVEITGTSQAGAINTLYIPHNAALTTITLPVTSVIGSLVQIVGEGAGGWKIAQNASQFIKGVGITTTTGTGGSLASTDPNCTVTLRLTSTNKWTITSSQGTLTPL